MDSRIIEVEINKIKYFIHEYKLKKCEYFVPMLEGRFKENYKLKFDGISKKIIQIALNYVYGLENNFPYLDATQIYQIFTVLDYIGFKKSSSKCNMVIICLGHEYLPNISYEHEFDHLLLLNDKDLRNKCIDIYITKKMKDYKIEIGKFKQKNKPKNIGKTNQLDFNIKDFLSNFNIQVECVKISDVFVNKNTNGYLSIEIIIDDYKFSIDYLCGYIDLKPYLIKYVNHYYNKKIKDSIK